MITAALVVIGVVLALLLVARDAAARRRERRLLEDLVDLQTRAQEHDRLANVGQLVSGLAQDLKSPLQGMLSNAEVLAESGPGDEAAVQELQEMRENVTRAAGIVRNLLAFTEMSSLDRRWHDLNDVVRRAVDGRRRVMAASGFHVSLDSGAKLPLVYVDGRQIEKVVATLLDPPLGTGRQRRPGDVLVTTRRGEAADRLVVEIDDPSVPVDDDEASWWGEVDACRRVLEAHGGSLDVARQRDGGFRFHLRLPITEQGGAQPT